MPVESLDANGECRMHVAAALCNLSRVEMLTESLCRQIGLESIRTYTVVLSISEAMSNAVRHAGPSTVSSPMQIHYQKRETDLNVCLSDSGDPLPAQLVARYEDHALHQVSHASADQLPDGGWGVDLILQGASRVSYRRAAGWNHLTLCFDLNV